jgi:competence protein ComEC
MDPSVFTTVIDGYLPEPHSSLLNGILFGIDLKTNKIFWQQLKAVGLVHLVVLSGSNIAILASITGNLTQKFSKSISCMITVFIILIFIVFVGPQAPIIRAGIMGILTVVAIIYGKKYSALWGLILSAIFIAVFFPDWLKTVSFYLSYSATIGLILFGKVSIKKNHNNLIDNLLHKIWVELKPTVIAQLFTTPIIFVYFRQISIISPITNLLVAFTIYPLMVFGFMTAVLGKISFGLGLIPSYICYGLLNYLVFVTETLSALPFAYVNLP